MPVDGPTLMLIDIESKYKEKPSSPAYDRLYEETGRWGHMFAVLHEELSTHFEAVNNRSVTT